jgi:ribosomal silencing factor RsfS
MGQLAFLQMFILVAISIDANDNRRHVHVFRKGKRHQHSLAKIWIERNGQQCVEIAESELSAKDNEMIVAAINRHWESINDQVTKAFNGEKTVSINIEK